MNSAEIKSMIDRGTPIEAFQADLELSRRYNCDLVSGSACVSAYRQLRETHRTPTGGQGATSYIYEQFAMDCIEEGWTQAHLDYACRRWRRKNTPFAPTFGELLAECNKGKSDPRGPGPHRAKYYEQQIAGAMRDPGVLKSPPSNEVEKISTDEVVAETVKKKAPPRRKIHMPRTVDEQLAQLKGGRKP